MKLIVGLGNPGKKYEKTRHNCGFMAIDYYAKKYNLTSKKKYNGEYFEKIINSEKIIFLKPQTYMNLSGECVLSFVKYFDINTDDIYIIYDDIDFELGTFKIKRDGSSGGHNGINNIIKLLKTEKLKRIRIKNKKNDIPLEDYVLKKLNEEEMNKINELLPLISEIIDNIPLMNIDDLMQKYNRN